MAAQADFQEFTSRPNLFLPLVFDHSAGQRARSNRHRCPAGGTRGSHRVKNPNFHRSSVSSVSAANS
jgi:hypothetical protein